MNTIEITELIVYTVGISADILEASNVAYIEDAADALGISTFRNYKFGQSGYFELYVHSNDGPAVEFVNDIKEQLEDYAVLDEADYSEREYAAMYTDVKEIVAADYEGVDADEVFNWFMSADCPEYPVRVADVADAVNNLEVCGPIV